MINLEEYPHSCVPAASAQMAEQIQDACNLTAVILEWARQAHVVCEHGHKVGKGTDWARAHPIHLAFLSKVQSLMHSPDLNAILDAHGWCAEAAKNCEGQSDQS